jgi:hypothetical protein
MKAARTLTAAAVFAAVIAFGIALSSAPAIAAPPGTWSVHLQMEPQGPAGSEDLTPFAAWNLYEIEAGFPAHPRETRHGGSGPRADWTAELGDAKWHLEDSGTPFRAARTPAEYRSLSLAGLHSPRVAEFALTAANYRALVIWGHGAGWDAQKIPALAARLRAQPVDWLAFDACLMQTLEVATELSEAAHFMTGSAQVQNFVGLPYRRIQVELAAGRAASPEGLALEVPRWFHQSLEAGGLHSRLEPGTRATETLSTIDLGILRAEFLPAWEGVSGALLDYWRERPLRRLRWMSVVLGNRRSAAGFLGGAQDLGVWLTSLQTLVRTENAALSPAAQALDLKLLLAHQALARAVPRYSLGTLYTTPEASPYWMGFRGVSIWQPTSHEEWVLGAPDFLRSRLYLDGAPTWRAVQAALFEL